MTAAWPSRPLSLRGLATRGRAGVRRRSLPPVSQFRAADCGLFPDRHGAMSWSVTKPDRLTKPELQTRMIVNDNATVSA